MTMHRRTTLGAAVAGVALTCWGCSDQTARERQFSTIRIPEARMPEAFTAARQVFREYFAIAEADPSTGVIRSRPREISPAASRERVRDMFTATPNRRREMAELRLMADGPGLIASVHVMTQRLDTSERRAFRPQTGDDRPGNVAPMERETSAGPGRAEEWVDVSRNVALEREILDHLWERLAPAGATRPAPATRRTRS